MKFVVSFVVVLLWSMSAQAARPNTQTMTAAEAKALVDKHGSIALSTSSFGYDRFVAKQSLCGGEKAVAAYVPTLDSDAAFIGYSCVSGSRDEIASSKKYARYPARCREGATRTIEQNLNGSEGENLSRICTNGKWQRLGVDPVGPKRVACTDGTYRTQKVSRGGGETVDQTRVCRDGKWYSVN